MDDIKRILVVSRSTKYCRKAVHYGILLAKKHEAELYVIHAIYNPFGVEGWNVPLPSHTVLAEEYKSMQQEAKTDLDNMINAENAGGMPIKVLISTEEPANKEVFRVVQEIKITMAIPTGGRKQCKGSGPGPTGEIPSVPRPSFINQRETQ